MGTAMRMHGTQVDLQCRCPKCDLGLCLSPVECHFRACFCVLLGLVVGDAAEALSDLLPVGSNLTVYKTLKDIL